MLEPRVRRHGAHDQVRFASAIRDVASAVISGHDESRNHGLGQLGDPPHPRISVIQLARGTLAHFAQYAVHQQRRDPLASPLGVGQRTPALIGIVPRTVRHRHRCDNPAVYIGDDAQIQRVPEETRDIVEILERMGAVAIDELEQHRERCRVRSVREADADGVRIVPFTAHSIRPRTPRDNSARPCE